MILRIFLLVTSFLVNSFAQDKCTYHYMPIKYEEASDALVEIIEDNFIDKNISFLPTLEDAKKLNIKSKIIKYKELEFPTTLGVWKLERLSKDITRTHLLLKDIEKLNELNAFNTFNDMLGNFWGDYDIDAYYMSLKPQSVRVYYKGVYFELSVLVYGIKEDATPLKATYADVVFTDVTKRVNLCKDKR